MVGADDGKSLTVYQQMLLKQLPRAMALQDFNPRSRTYGCCDRGYWQYKTLTSFPSSVYQQLALPFALAFTSAEFANPYYHDQQQLDRAVAAVNSWGQFQHRSGAVDEWYRHEFSYCPTAFTALGMAETLLLLREHMAPVESDACLQSLLKACRWLTKRFNPVVMNQNLAACGALWNAYRLTDDDQWRRAFTRTWERTLEHLDPEGWFLEYDGADLGYTTLALDALAAMHRRGCDEGVLETAQGVCRFVESFIAGDGGDLAGRLGSRGTAHTFPYGLNYFAPQCEAARSAAAHLNRGHETENSLAPHSVDDRYFSYFYLPQFAQAATINAAIGETTSPKPEAANWPASGFRIQRHERGTVIANTRRQGAFNLIVSGEPVHHNFGYWIETAAGDRYASCGWNGGDLDVEEDLNGACRARGPFSQVGDKLPLVKGAVPFTVLSEWLLFLEPIAERFQQFVKQRKIVRRTDAPLLFERQVLFGEEELTVVDRIEMLDACPQLVAVGPVDDVDVHSPSAKFSGNARRVTIDETTATAWAEKLNRDGHLTLRTTYATGTNGAFGFRSIEIVDESPTKEIQRPAA